MGFFWDQIKSGARSGGGDGWRGWLFNEPVPIVALPGFVTEVANQSVHVGDAHSVFGAGFGDDVFFYHDAAEVVCAEFQCDLPDLGPLRDPRALNILEIVEVNPAERLSAEVFVRTGRRQLQARVCGLESPANESCEPSGPVLLLPDPLQVQKAVIDGFNVPEHHGCRRVQSEPVCSVHDLEPLICGGLAGRQLRSNPINQNLGAAAGNRAEPCGSQKAYQVCDRDFVQSAQMDDLIWAETVDVNLRETALDMRQHVHIPLEAQLGMMPALQKNLRSAESDCLLDFPVQLIKSDDIGIRVCFASVERAEFTANCADVRVVDVSIDDVGYDAVAMSAISGSLGQSAPSVGEDAELV